MKLSIGNFISTVWELLQQNFNLKVPIGCFESATRLDNANSNKNNTGLQKIPMVNFQYSVRFSPGEYEYENYFFKNFMSKI